MTITKYQDQKMSDNNKIVNGLWIGSQLSLLELLTLSSFVQNGHEFHLWLYEEINQKLPRGVIIKNANEIIDKERVFKYKNETISGIGKGSYAGFSDVFRYKLLYEKGGWWVDMDVTCLKYFDVQEEYFFPSEITMPLTGRILKAPARCELMKFCYETALVEIDANNVNWYKPIGILIKGVSQLGLKNHITSDFINWDSYVFVDVLRNLNVNIPTKWSAFHWSNEQWRNRGFDKNSFVANSAFEKLLRKYQVISGDQNKVPEKFDLAKRLQLFLFAFLFSRIKLLRVLKRVKSRFSMRHNLWI